MHNPLSSFYLLILSNLHVQWAQSRRFDCVDQSSDQVVAARFCPDTKPNLDVECPAPASCAAAAAAQPDGAAAAASGDQTATQPPPGEAPASAAAGDAGSEAAPVADSTSDQQPASSDGSDPPAAGTDEGPAAPETSASRNQSAAVTRQRVAAHAQNGAEGIAVGEFTPIVSEVPDGTSSSGGDAGIIPESGVVAATASGFKDTSGSGGSTVAQVVAGGDVLSLVQGLGSWVPAGSGSSSGAAAPQGSSWTTAAARGGGTPLAGGSGDASAPLNATALALICPAGAAVDTRGTCCHGTALDNKGRCCDYGRIDACGTCNGTGFALDAHNACCKGQLDAQGICCPAGSVVDECGVCNGASSCSVRLQLVAKVPRPGLYLSPNGNLNKRLRWAIQAQIAAAVSAHRGAQFDRSLISVALSAAGGGGEAAVDAVGRARRAQDAAAWSRNSSAAAVTRPTPPAAMTSSLAAALPSWAAAFLGRSQHSIPSASSPPSKPKTAAALVEPPSPQPLTTSNSSSNSSSVGNDDDFDVVGQLLIDITIRNGGANAPPDTALSVAAAADLISSAGLSLPGDGEGRLRYDRLETVLRVGTCGDGVCEVGERVTTDNPNEGCPADCGFPFLACPPFAAPALLNSNGTAGNGMNTGDSNGSSLAAAGAVVVVEGGASVPSPPPATCNGFGVCFNALGACSCFTGYAGSDCSDCALGYTRVRGYCVTQTRTVTRVTCTGSSCTDAAASALAAAAAAIADAKAAGYAAQQREFHAGQGAVIGVTLGTLVLVAAAALITYRYHTALQLELYRKFVGERLGKAAE